MKIKIAKIIAAVCFIASAVCVSIYFAFRPTVYSSYVRVFNNTTDYSDFVYYGATHEQLNTFEFDGNNATYFYTTVFYKDGGITHKSSSINTFVYNDSFTETYIYFGAL